MVQPASRPAAAGGEAAPVGRPRSGDRQRPGDTPRDEILDAAAELFTRRGYSATSTRTIAEAVGLRQASLYYHFASKEELLGELLAGTVRPSLAHAVALEARTDLEPDEKLLSLAAYDAALLCGGRWNLGALYLLPEVRGDRFARFRAERARLRAAYAALVARLPAGPEGTDLVFALVEGVITIRSERELPDVEAMARRVAVGCLRLAGVGPERIATLLAR